MNWCLVQVKMLLVLNVKHKRNSKIVIKKIQMNMVGWPKASVIYDSRMNKYG